MNNIGIIGAGYMGQAHARVVSEIAKKFGMKLGFVVEPIAEKASEVASKYQIKAYSNLNEALEKERNFIAIVASPTSTHIDIIDLLLSNGIEYILVEKPLGDDVERARELTRKYSNSTLEKVMVGHIERFNPAYLELKSTISEGILGEPITFFSRRVGPYVGRILDVGVILDLAIHDIDISIDLFGKVPSKIHSYAYNVYSQKHEDSCLIVLNYVRFLHIIEANRITPYKERKAIYTGTRGVGVLDFIQQTLDVYTGSWKMERVIAKKEPLLLEDEAFLRAVSNRVKVPITYYDGLRNLEIAMKAMHNTANHSKDF